jgi:alkanesulfonate monooxygenase SsuD/methylene tetrahydromethanopterin reductase-like flavin-dependent oxidoreductase (luciferase family)
MGFDQAWTYDHLTWRSLRDGPWFAAMPTLVAAALATSHLRLGTMVASPTFRHPVTFAKELMTLDDISDGRVTAGIGAGGDGFDATALRTVAWSMRERTERFEEFVAMLDRLLSEPSTSYEGRYYIANEARAAPGEQRATSITSSSRRRACWCWMPRTRRRHRPAEPRLVLAAGLSSQSVAATAQRWPTRWPWQIEADWPLIGAPNEFRARRWCASRGPP